MVLKLIFYFLLKKKSTTCSDNGAKPSHPTRRKIQNNKALTNEEIVNLHTITYFSHFDLLYTSHVPARHMPFDKKFDM